MTTIIMTEEKCRNGKFWTFTIKESGDIIAEIDRYEKGYRIFSGGGGAWYQSLVGTRTKKNAAFEFAKKVVRESIFGGIEFKLNAVRYVSC
jgi:hypothetical protein